MRRTCRRVSLHMSHMRAGRATDKRFWCQCPITTEQALEGASRGMGAWMVAAVWVLVGHVLVVGHVLLGLADVPQGGLPVVVEEAVDLRAVAAAAEVEEEVVAAEVAVGEAVAAEAKYTLIILYMYPR